MWPFSRTENRASVRDVDATDALVAALQRQAAGTATDPDSLAVAEACAGLWERSLASATVTPPSSAALRPLTPILLAMIGRGLARRGDAVFLIGTNEDVGATLTPASSWNVRGDAAEDSWRYRLDLAGPSRTRTMDLPAASVLHFRMGADLQTPWRGRGPLRRSVATSSLAGEIERSFNAEAKLPVGRLLPLQGTPDQLAEITPGIREGGLLLVGAGQGGVGEQVPSARYSVQGYGPNPSTAFEMLRSHVAEEIAAAFGVPPTLFNPGGDGAGQREAWRRFWIATVAPIGAMIEAELRAKLDPVAMVSFDALRASDEDGRSRAVSRRANAFKTFIDANVERGEAMRLAGLDR